MSLPDSKNLVTVERLSAVLGGSDGTGGLWGKTKDLIDNIPSANLVGDNHITVTSDDTTHTVTIATDIAAQTAYTSKGTATKVPQITTNTLGQVTSITEVEISGVTPASHTHGNITNDGKVGSTADYAVVTTTGGAITATSLATSAPTASGNALSFIDSVSQNSKGKITATKKSVTVDSTYSATGTNPVNGTAIAAAIGTLDVSAIAGSASKTLTSISETDGKISATYSDIAIAQSQVTDLTTDLGNKAPKNSPALTGTPTAPTAAAGTNTTQIATTAFVKTAVTNGLAEADALVYKGTIAGGSTGSYGALTVAANKGDVYKVTTAGKVDGVTVEVGDMLICNTDSTAAATSSNYATIAANWDFIQTNLDGVVTGPASATDGNIALFDGATGKLLKNSSYSPSSFASSSHNHDSVYFKSAGSVTLVSGSATKIGTSNGSDVKLTLPTIPAAAKDANLNLQINGGTATTVFSANASSAATVTFGSGTANGTIDVNGTDVAVTGLGSAAYTESSDYATSGHTHTTSLASDSGTATVNLAANTTYKLTAGGTSVIFKTPADGNTDTKVKATAKTDDVNYKILATASASPTSGNATEAVYDADITLNPSTNTIAANISGNAATASKINTSAKIGDTNKGVYIAADGTVTAMSYTVSKSVPSNAVFTDASVTAVDNHYAPAEDSTAEKDASGGTATQLPTSSTGTLVQVVTGVKMDAKGHVTGVVSKGLWSPDNNTTYTPQKLGFGYGTCGTAAATAAKAVTLSGYEIVTNGIVAVKFTYAVPASATLNINSKGAKNIYYRGAAITSGVIGAGDIATFIYDGTQYQLLSVGSGEQEMTDQEVTDLLAALT